MKEHVTQCNSVVNWCVFLFRFVTTMELCGRKSELNPTKRMMGTVVLLLLRCTLTVDDWPDTLATWVTPLQLDVIMPVGDLFSQPVQHRNIEIYRQQHTDIDKSPCLHSYLPAHSSISEADCSGLLWQKGQNSCWSVLLKFRTSNQMVVMWSAEGRGDQCHLLLWVLGLWWLCGSCLRDWVWEDRQDFGGRIWDSGDTHTHTHTHTHNKVCS